VTSRALPGNRLLSGAEFFRRAATRLSLNPPAPLTYPPVSYFDDHDGDPGVMAAIAAMRQLRTAAVLVPVIARAEPTVLFTRRTGHLTDHASQVAFPGGKMEVNDATPAAAALREAEEEIALGRCFVEPIGYLDVHITPSGYCIVPTLARVREGFALQVSPGEVDSAFEVPLAFLMAPQNYGRQQAQWNQLRTSVSAIRFEDNNNLGRDRRHTAQSLRADLQRLMLIGEVQAP
jgi:8-oxo-dGTP pyrophosphatase MutT (NUDIX family)